MTYPNTIFSCRGVKKNTAAVTDATHGRFTILTGTPVVDLGGAGAPGPEDIEVVGPERLTFEIFGTDLNALLALIGSAVENIVFQYKASGGTNKKITLKNGKITGWTGPVEVPNPQAAGGTTQLHGVRGECEWASDDTWATMITDAADT